MNLKHELEKIPHDRAALRTFGWVMGGLLALLACGSFWLRGLAWKGVVLAGLSAAFAAAAWKRPKALARIHRAWFALALAMGWGVLRVLLTVVFFGVMTPLSLLLRLLGRDILGARIDRSAATYWSPCSPGDAAPARADHLF